MDKSIKYIESLNICIDEYVVLACSYGPDSMALLDILMKCNLNIVVAHVNHRLRKESEEEYKLLEVYCKNHSIIFEGMEINEYPKGNVEMQARIIRYDFFEKIVNKYKSKYLFTAHHGDDLIETILMRLNRGSSLKGYAGFSIITNKGSYSIVRPLIYYTKQELLDYVIKNNIPYAIDQSNLSIDYTRNKYRHKVLPVLKEINPDVNLKYLKFSEMIHEYDAYFSNEIESIYSKIFINNHIDLNDFNILPSLMQKKLLEYILLILYKENINKLNDKHIEMILNLINGDKQNGSVNLPNKIIVTKYYNILEFNEYTETLNEYDYIFDNKLDIAGGTIIKIEQTDILKSNYIIRLNSNDISMPIHIRSRHDGDKMTIKNFIGTKKISDIFINSKIKPIDRDSYPIVTDNNDKILWIPGVKKSQFDKQPNDKYDIILKYIQKGEKE